jgi:hypothetical protein
VRPHLGATRRQTLRSERHLGAQIARIAELGVLNRHRRFTNWLRYWVDPVKATRSATSNIRGLSVDELGTPRTVRSVPGLPSSTRSSAAQRDPVELLPLGTTVVP